MRLCKRLLHLTVANVHLQFTFKQFVCYKGCTNFSPKVIFSFHYKGGSNRLVQEGHAPCGFFRLFLRENLAREVFQEAFLQVLEDINAAPLDTEETSHAYAKRRNFEPPWLPQTDPQMRQHLNFSSLGHKFLIYRWKKLMWSNTSFE